jgi:hypothetical protein
MDGTGGTRFLLTRREVPAKSGFPSEAGGLGSYVASFYLT